MKKPTEKNHAKITDIEGFEIVVSWEDSFTCPNEIWDIWEPCGSADPDAVVYTGGYQGNDGYWKNKEVPFTELVKSYEAEKRENPEADARTSQRRELVHFLDGHHLKCTVKARRQGVTLAEERIMAEYSHVKFDCEAEAAIQCVNANVDLQELAAHAQYTVDALSK